METVQAFADWMAGLPAGWIYAVVLLIAYGENVIPPVPGDVAIVIGGSLVGLGLVAPVPLLALAIGGSTLGFLTMYALGQRLGDAIHDPKRLRWIPRGTVQTVDQWFERWGIAVVAANRFLAGGRAVIALMAGASRLPVGRVAWWAGASAALWCSLLVGGGYLVGTEWERVLSALRTYGRVVTALVAVLALGLAVRFYVGWREQRRARSSAGGRDATVARATRNREDPPGSDNGTGPR